MCSLFHHQNILKWNLAFPTFSFITKTSQYYFDPLEPHFYIVKLGFTGVYIIFLFLLKNIDCGHSLEPPRRGGSNEYPQSMFWAEIWKILQFFIWKFSVFGSEFFLYIWIGVFWLCEVGNQYVVSIDWLLSNWYMNQHKTYLHFTEILTLIWLISSCVCVCGGGGGGG